jgi:hypothetical protein
MKCRTWVERLSRNPFVAYTQAIQSIAQTFHVGWQMFPLATAALNNEMSSHQGTHKHHPGLHDVLESQRQMA